MARNKYGSYNICDLSVFRQDCDGQGILDEAGATKIHTGFKPSCSGRFLPESLSCDRNCRSGAETGEATENRSGDERTARAKGWLPRCTRCTDLHSARHARTHTQVRGRGSKILKYVSIMSKTIFSKATLRDIEGYPDNAVVFFKSLENYLLILYEVVLNKYYFLP